MQNPIASSFSFRPYTSVRSSEVEPSVRSSLHISWIHMIVFAQATCIYHLQSRNVLPLSLSVNERAALGTKSLSFRKVHVAVPAHFRT